MATASRRKRVRAESLEKSFRTEPEQAAYLGVCVPTLRTWRQRRCGPPWLKVGKKVVYSKASTEAFLLSREVNPAKLQEGRQ